MSTASRIFAAVCIAAVLVATGAVFAAAGVVYAGGWIVVHVQEKAEDGSNVHVALPGAAASLAMAFVPDRLLGRIEGCDQAMRWVPVVEAAIAELERCPDGVSFVEVDTADETVRISKKRGALVVDVDTPAERVRVSIPLRTVSSVAGRLTRFVRSRARSV